MQKSVILAPQPALSCAPLSRSIHSCLTQCSSSCDLWPSHLSFITQAATPFPSCSHYFVSFWAQVQSCSIFSFLWYSRKLRNAFLRCGKYVRIKIDFHPFPTQALKTTEMIMNSITSTDASNNLIFFKKNNWCYCFRDPTHHFNLSFSLARAKT